MTNIINEKYMLTNENIIKLLPNINSNNNRQSNKVNLNKIINNRDELFWIIYKIVEGEYKYETNCNFKTEKDFKIKCIEDLRLIKTKLKTYKLCLNRVEDQLLNHKKINLEAFFALSLLFSLNIFYVWNNKFFEFNCNENSDIYIINNNNNIIIEDDNKIEFYKNNLFYVENLNKPLKSITSYSKDQLIDIAKKLSIDNIPSKITKKDIYEKIQTKM
ncbi:hypothetical protein ceV_303 [Chrysochromulina ericina virus CeV-01B]|uniref:Uncharacterized protein n=1 Tax=Chrysochromulina ericina virus CeV-01B TaxID=3070830 RepID=A0A0N7G7M6_9VIRU|nr:hypothetical protein ceV_303 [Chrysochromulina ericina virus]ALH23209.1 hypothetical protein ceV_303 [Chrysochromulina ericina virus CeV-01B]|tara:strand:- start:37392 stop:38042 length:651 start_codon:yes stop_codon:yes gene_type:complete